MGRASALSQHGAAPGAVDRWRAAHVSLGCRAWLRAGRSTGDRRLFTGAARTRWRVVQPAGASTRRSPRSGDRGIRAESVWRKLAGTHLLRCAALSGMVESPVEIVGV